MKLDGYEVVGVTPREAASGGKAVACPVAKCIATMRFDGTHGWYTIRAQYFDQNNGVSRFRLLVGTQVIDEWAAADDLPTGKIDGSSSTRHSTTGIALRPGDEIRIEGVPGAAEPAGLDYVEILRSHNQ